MVPIINACDIEYQLEKKYISALRAIFEIDNFFVYNENDTLTKIIITSEYPQKDANFKTPQLFVTNIGFQFNMETSFGGNYYNNVINDQNIHVGRKYLNVIPYNVSVMCLADYFTSKNLANKTFNYITFVAKGAFEELNLNIQNVMKGPTSPQQQYPEHIFETPISIQGTLYWNGTKTNDIEDLNLTDRINYFISSL